MKYNSQRNVFADELYKQMQREENIFLVVGGLGYQIFDKIFKKFPHRCINTESAEQAMVGIAVGLSLQGKIPFVYSITNFLIYRPFETLRNYVQYERVPVKLVCAGRNQDYRDSGISHWSYDVKPVLNILSNIRQYWPEDSLEIPHIVKETIRNKLPVFISLKR